MLNEISICKKNMSLGSKLRLIFRCIVGIVNIYISTDIYIYIYFNWKSESWRTALHSKYGRWKKLKKRVKIWFMV